MKEIWKAVVGYEGVYEVSNIGRVKSMPRRMVPRPRIIKPKVDEWGYRRVALCNKGKRKDARVHVLVLMAFRGPPSDPKMECRHLDGNPSNNTLDNVMWDYHINNCQDQIAHGTSNRGERCGMAKLTEKEIIEIRAKHAAGSCTVLELCDLYGVSRRTIGKVVDRVTWKHI